MFTACTTAVTYQPISANLPPKPLSYEIKVYYESDYIPREAKKIGRVIIKDTGLSVDCGLEQVIQQAKTKARKVGGDAIQITKIIEPYARSTCYQISANILSVNISEIDKETLVALDKAMLKFTREKMKKYFTNNDTLNYLEGFYKYKTTFRNGEEIIIGDIAITQTPSKEAFFGVLYSDYLDSIPIGWGIIEKSYVNNIAYGNIYAGSIGEVEFKIDDGKLTFNAKLKGTPFTGTLIKLYPRTNKTAIKQTEENERLSQGTGFILSSNGLIITNYHVIAESKSIEVLFPDKNITKQASLKLKDKNNDIAILQIIDFDLAEITSHTIPYSIGNINSVKTGQEVFTLGFPLGSIMGTKPRLSSGRINSLYGIEEDPRLLQIGNPLQPGNSGGPLFNENGDLVGIVVSGLNAEYFYENLGIIPQNVNFAVKVSYLESLIGMLPDEENISNRENLLIGKKMEEQIELLNSYIVQVRSY